MSNMNTQLTTAVGLDVGTSRIVVAQRQDKDIQFATQLNAFVTIPFSKLTQSVLKKERIPHLVQESEITIYGDESERFANLFHRETRRPMLRGILNPEETNGLMLVRQIVTLLTSESNRRMQKLCFSIPAAPLGAGEAVTSHEAELKSMLQELGYEARSISEGLAVVYGEMESSNYTGIGISCGGGLCNVCLAYLSVGRLHRCKRRRGATRTGHAHPHHQRRVVPLQRPLHQQNPAVAGRLLRGHDAGAGRSAKGRLRQRSEHAQAEPSHSLGARGRKCSCAGLSRPLRKNRARRRVTGGDLRDPGSRKPHALHCARGTGGGVERYVNIMPAVSGHRLKPVPPGIKQLRAGGPDLQSVL